MTPRRKHPLRDPLRPAPRKAGWQLLAGTTRLAVSRSREKLRGLASWLAQTGTDCQVVPFAGGDAEVAS